MFVIAATRSVKHRRYMAWLRMENDSFCGFFREQCCSDCGERTRDRSSEAAKARPEITYSDDVGLDRRGPTANATCDVRVKTDCVTTVRDM